MDIEQLLLAVKEGRCSINEGLAQLRHLPYEELGYAKIDHHRRLRCGLPEVIFCQGKTVAQVVEIARRLLAVDGELLATRASAEIYAAIEKLEPAAVYHPQARVITHQQETKELTRGEIVVISAGTADIPIAEEAVVTVQFLGSRVSRLYDVGVAGLHRLLDKQEKLVSGRVFIVVAGMEGALASVVASLVARPVIGVPTSIGYGSHFGGLSPLLTMLNSCATGLAVVNIDNGFGAACLAHSINLLGEETE